VSVEREPQIIRDLLQCSLSRSGTARSDVILASVDPGQAFHQLGLVREDIVGLGTQDDPIRLAVGRDEEGAPGLPDLLGVTPEILRNSFIYNILYFTKWVFTIADLSDVLN
jgi:hypothetical protein